MCEWTSVKERLPEITRDIMSDKVLIAQGLKDKQIDIAWYRKLHYADKGEWVTGDLEPISRQELITHWMTLPNKPE